MTQPAATLLSAYQPYPFTLDSVALTFRLSPSATRVAAKLHFTPRGPESSLFLHGEALKLVSISVNSNALDPAALEITDEGLTIPARLLPQGAFTLETEVEIDPAANTRCEGLYMSGGMYCTQCEAEGFRRITYFPDRPDVMSTYTVRIESDMPVLLSNGNPTGAGPGWAEWHDPWPKPAYLFALVAGDLEARHDHFTTRSGLTVDLAIYVRPGGVPQTEWAMEAIKKSMRWDEEVYGREYDLDVFNVVAVDDFNMGAMENKGLNIFNSRLVFASPETATDLDYERIEGVIAHEYFHNWTGNRITCRDWFQLCLKEGLTVFRDQQFTKDMRSQAVKRIEDVVLLRGRQFREDQGPLAHPPRPDRYVEINNFYTATVYEKGAEVIGMLKRLVGDAGYAKALDLYFERHDGDAATIEDWLKVFEDATGRDLAQFKRWYTDAGTPHLHVTEEWHPGLEGGTFALHFRQQTPPTPGQPKKPPRVLPVLVGLLNPNGDEVVPTTLLEMTEAEQSFRFTGLAARPTASILRDFSAPVVLHRATSDEERAFLLAHDTDPFARFEAGRGLALDALMQAALHGTPAPATWLHAVGRVLADESLDPAFRALVLRLPGEEEVATALHVAGHTPDPLKIHAARKALSLALARQHETILARDYDAMAQPGPYSPEAGPAAMRALRLACLTLLSKLDGGARAQALYDSADNMTETQGALAALISEGKAEAALAAYEAKWAGNRLVMDKFFTVQPMLAEPAAATRVARSLAARADFDWKNPNRFRALVMGLAGNHAGFHAADGSGYEFVADWLLKLDPLNPQTAARISTVFETWHRYDEGRRAQAAAQLDRIASAPGLSRDLGEMVSRMRAAR